MTILITFWGASGTVTGSKYLLEIDEGSVRAKILIDAGIFQGDRLWKEKNWDTYDSTLLQSIDACILTHAHIDHTGFLPRLVKMGLRCPVYSSPATAKLSTLLLLDSAHLQEEEAAFRSRKGNSRHSPVLPLYTNEDAQKAIGLFKTLATHRKHQILPNIFVEFRAMGHILGACSLTLDIGGRRINFSGDIGRYGVPILKDPEAVEFGDLLLIESTYADTEKHKPAPEYEFERVVHETVDRKGVLVIPSFAVGRTQSLLYSIRELKLAGKIPDIPVIVDSPMAKDVTDIYSEHPDECDADLIGVIKSGQRPFACSKLEFTKQVEQSKALNSRRGPMIIISASGMATGGRILHHLQQRLPHTENTILFVGYQPPGGRGDLLKQGREWISIFHDHVPVRAQIRSIDGLSAHADRSELLRWYKSSAGTPGKIAVVHGEAESARHFAELLTQSFGVKAFPPSYRETWEV